MSMLNEAPSVSVKRKNIQVILEYCLDNRIEFKVAPRSLPDEYEVEFSISDVMKAISLGMFLKENKLELSGLAFSAPKTVAPAPKATRGVKKEKEENKPVQKSEHPAPVSDNNNGLSFTAEANNEPETVTSGEPNPFEEEDLFMNN